MANKSEKFAPHSVEAEEAALGSILINPEAVLRIAGLLDEKDFFIVKNAWVWRAIMALHERREAIDMLTVSEELNQRNMLDQIGGMAYLNTISNRVPTHIHVESYAQMVHRAAVRRRIIAAASDIAAAALQEDVELDETMAYCRQAMSKVLAYGQRRQGKTAKELAAEHFEKWEERQNRGGGILGLPTGSPLLDTLTGGLLPQRVTFIGGRPKMGKTAMLLALLLHVARYLKSQGRAEWCYLFSLEMGADDLIERLLSVMARIPLNKLELGKLTDEENSRYLNAVSELSALRILIDDTRGLSAKDIDERMQVYAYRHGPAALIELDYIQLMRGGRAKSYTGDNRHTEVADAAYEAADLALNYNCHVVAGAQIKQEVEGRDNKRPGASDFAESDGIRRAASHLITIYRHGVYNHDEHAPACDLALVANRHGETGMAGDMRWSAPYAAIEPVEPISL